MCGEKEGERKGREAKWKEGLPFLFASSLHVLTSLERLYTVGRMEKSADFLHAKNRKFHRYVVVMGRTREQRMNRSNAKKLAFRDTQRRIQLLPHLSVFHRRSLWRMLSGTFFSPLLQNEKKCKGLAWHQLSSSVKKKKKKHTVDCVHFSLFSFVLHFVLNSYQIRREREKDRDHSKKWRTACASQHTTKQRKKKWKRVRLAAKHTHRGDSQQASKRSRQKTATRKKNSGRTR